MQSITTPPPPMATANFRTADGVADATNGGYVFDGEARLRAFAAKPFVLNPRVSSFIPGVKPTTAAKSLGSVHTIVLNKEASQESNNNSNNNSNNTTYDSGYSSTSTPVRLSSPTISRAEHTRSYEDTPNQTDYNRLKAQPWYHPICSCGESCLESTTGGLNTCQLIRLGCHTQIPSGTHQLWNTLIQGQQACAQSSKHDPGKKDLTNDSPWWNLPGIIDVLGDPREPSRVAVSEEAYIAMWTWDERPRIAKWEWKMPTLECDLEKDRVVRMEGHMRRELLYVLGMIYGLGDYWASVLRNPEWFPGFKNPVKWQLKSFFPDFNTFENGESIREIMEEVLVRVGVLEPRSRNGLLNIEGMTDSRRRIIDGHLALLEEVLASELDYDEQRNPVWWDDLPYFMQRFICRFPVEERPREWISYCDFFQKHDVEKCNQCTLAEVKAQQWPGVVVGLCGSVSGGEGAKE